MYSVIGVCVMPGRLYTISFYFFHSCSSRCVFLWTEFERLFENLSLVKIRCSHAKHSTKRHECYAPFSSCRFCCCYERCKRHTKPFIKAVTRVMIRTPAEPFKNFAYRQRLFVTIFDTKALTLNWMSHGFSRLRVCTHSCAMAFVAELSSFAY